MRIDGTLAKWNDDRGFGFITPTQGGPEVFAHISAFPRDGQRPRLGELLSFEIGIGKDGKQQAKSIVCPTRPAEKPYRLSEPAKRPHKPGLLERLIPLGFLVALGAYGYSEYTGRMNPQTVTESQTSDAVTAVESSGSLASVPFHCDGRQHCSQMGSRAEAEYFLRNCPDTKMDGDHDGIPCENDSRF
ncbi:MAG: cold-shock protein [Betaproteobacteria bacterium HGW-Betaproteobacteria-17]|nr:MAG: cold-shock protein [Betaproteobacteria bacterium HGW-Betaproteobacteria-17]